MTKKLHRGSVLAIGLSTCKREVRVSAAYCKPLDASDGHQVACVTWTIRRATTADGGRVWEAKAFEGGRLGHELRLTGLDDLSYCRADRFSSLMQTLGLHRSMGMPSLMGAQKIFVTQVDSTRLMMTVEELRQLPGFAQVGTAS